MEKTLEWFKKEVSPDLLNYKITYRSYKNGDFGDLDQIIIESKSLGGGIDFWSSGRLGIELYDYEKEKQIINVLLEPTEEYENHLKKINRNLEKPVKCFKIIIFAFEHFLIIKFYNENRNHRSDGIRSPAPARKITR